LAIPTFSGTGGKTLLDNAGATISAGVITATGFAGPLTGNASTVTTNANLTGPITSVGNATSIASQTGTGTTFAMSASPTFTGTVGAADLTTTGRTTSAGFTASGVAGTNSLDTSDNAISVANAGTVIFANFAGLIIINCLNVGSNALYIVGGGTVTNIANAGAPQGTVTYSGVNNGYIFTNTSGATFTFAFTTIRNRAAA
jgi:hypothetical protein